MKSLEGQLVDILNGSIYPVKITIKGSIITQIEKISSAPLVYILPGFIDAHVHIESSLLSPVEFAKSAVRHGCVAAISDPHEIANVCGVKGIEYMIHSARTVPFKIFFGVPSCVPATSQETSGACIGINEVSYLFEKYHLKYLSEVMNFPAVIQHSEEVIAKIDLARKYGKRIDGHAPGLTGKDLEIYAQSGIQTDHECVSMEEAEEKINCGMKILIREGSAARNFSSLSALIDKYPQDVMLCTDDCHPAELVSGHICAIVNRGLRSGINIFNLLRAACINPVKHYDLDIGQLRENDPADFILSSSINQVEVIQTWIKGGLVYSENKVHFFPLQIKPINNFHAEIISTEDLHLRAKSKFIRVMHVIDGELLTDCSIEEALIENGLAVSNPDRDLLKIVVVNRYIPSVPVVGFIKNMGLHDGAIASSVAHDSHNIIAVGNTDLDIARAVNAIILAKGGLALYDGTESHILPLEIAGLMSVQPVEDVLLQLDNLNERAHTLGCRLKSPFMSLSFMALLVIPHLKIGDRGLFDADHFAFTDLFVSGS